MTPPPQLSIGTVFAGMRRGAEANRSVLIKVTLLFAALTAASTALILLGTAGIALSLGASVLLGAAYSGMVAAMISLPGGPDPVAEVWTAVRPVLSRLVWASLLVGIAAGVGLVFLIIPGLILLTIWAVVAPVIVVERVAVFESLRRSRELVGGNGWRVFGFLICLALVSAVVLLLAYLASAPFGTGILGSIVFQFLISCTVNALASIGPAALYNELDGLTPETEPPL